MTDVQPLHNSTPAPTEEEARVAFDVEARIKQTIRTMREAWIDLAADLHRFNEERMWDQLGYPSFEQWLAGPEIDLGRRQVYALLEVWRDLVVKRDVTKEQLEGVQISKLSDTLPAVRRGYVDPEEALADARALGRDDLREKYAGVNHTTPSGKPLDATTEPEWAVCHACGQRYQVKPS